jgi:hypothetical protein
VDMDRIRSDWATSSPRVVYLLMDMSMNTVGFGSVSSLGVSLWRTSTSAGRRVQIPRRQLCALASWYVAGHKLRWRQLD